VLADCGANTIFDGAAALAALVIGFTLFLIVRTLSKQHTGAELRAGLEKVASIPPSTT